MIRSVQFRLIILKSSILLPDWIKPRINGHLLAEHFQFVHVCIRSSILISLYVSLFVDKTIAAYEVNNMKLSCMLPFVMIQLCRLDIYIRLNASTPMLADAHRFWFIYQNVVGQTASAKWDPVFHLVGQSSKIKDLHDTPTQILMNENSVCSHIFCISV